MVNRLLKNTSEVELEQITQVNMRIASLGLDAGVGGNISIRLDSGVGILITTSGSGVLDAPHDSFIEVDYEGNPLGSELKPSKDLPVHLDIYRLCPHVKAIVHTHSPVATSYSVFDKEIPLLTVVSKKLTHLPVLEVDDVGRDQQGKIIAQHLNESQMAGILMRNHGVLATGESILKAQKLAELIELTAKIALNSELMSQ